MQKADFLLIGGGTLVLSGSICLICAILAHYGVERVRRMIGNDLKATAWIGILTFLLGSLLLGIALPWIPKHAPRQ
jgi:hypothetical protein